jgi:hypothetical protein
VVQGCCGNWTRKIELRKISRKERKARKGKKMNSISLFIFFLCELCVLCESPLESGPHHTLIYRTEYSAAFLIEHLNAHAVAEL